jgi:mono/diheme cytochrome c family protein
MVIEWDESDTRPPEERQAALFDFMYSTYESSAWIPQSLFDSNLVTQAIVGDVPTIVGDRVGLVLWRDNPLVTAFGMAPSADTPGPVKWTVNCVVCHMAEIDGVAYFGAGTKTFDERWLGEALKRLTSEPWRGRLRGSPDYDLAAEAGRILASHHHDKIDSLTRARSTAFAASHVELYMRTHGNAMPPVDHVGRGDVKTPPLWHTRAKMDGGRWYSDGSFAGRYPLMASSMELEKDRPFDALVAHVIPAIREQFDAVVQHLKPPRYPYPIDHALAERGRALFNSAAVGCSQCHGIYDGRGHVDWPGVHADVGTDRSRLDLVTPEFIDAFERSPLAAGGALTRSSGYAATPLTGVWANYPYLHNGSVPTLHHLLGPVSERPRIFQVTAARSFDQERVGQPLVAGRGQVASESELRKQFGGDRDWFNTARPGSSREGHDVWPRIRSNENRRALVEYLKTL